MTDVQYIVDELKNEPFKMDFTLLGFTEQQPRELLQMLSDVFSVISPKHQKVEVFRETPEQTANRLVEFLKIVKYKPNLDPENFRLMLQEGDIDVIYPILKWVLPQPELLTKRAYVGYYLSFPNMPEELNFDADVAGLKDEMKLLQQDFIDYHKNWEQISGVKEESTVLRNKIKQLEDEKERLREKVTSAKLRYERLPERQQYMDVCGALRKSQDDEITMSQQLQQQKQVLEKAENAHQKSATKLRELQNGITEGSSQKLLDTLTQEVESLRFQVNERCPKELERKQRRLKAIKEVADNVNEVDLQHLQMQEQSIAQDIAAIKQRREEAEKAMQGNKAYLQLRQAQQMATVVQRKKEEIMAKLERMQEKKLQLADVYEKKMAADADAERQAVTEEEWREKYEAIKNRLPEYKKVRKELGEIEAEVSVLAHTVEVIEGTEASIKMEVSKVEQTHGVEGFTETATNLEAVSEQKSAVDEQKGATLEEISRTIAEINNAIRDRKSKLAPSIKQLRTVREAFNHLEADYNDKKLVYDQATGAAESKTAALDGEVTGLKTEISENESKYHLLNCQMANLDCQLGRVTAPGAEKIKDKLQEEVSRAEDAAKDLKERQRNVKDTHSTGLSQIDIMNDLVKLLQLKIEHRRSGHIMGMGMAGMAGMAGMDGGQQFNTATANVLAL